LRVLIAPDAFKGSMTNLEACDAMAAGLRDSGFRGTIQRQPMADGGDGTLTALAYSQNGRLLTHRVHGPYGDLIEAEWWLGADGVAVIELARAAGLATTSRRRPMDAATYGVGELIRSALDAGATAVTIACGGSASVDGGMGLLAALGARCYDRDGALLVPAGFQLTHVHRLELPTGISDLPIAVWADVQSPIHGPSGAAAVYGPQKGATPKDVEHLDRGLKNWARILGSTTGRSVGELAGGGAAGGVAAALHAVFGTPILSGVDAIAEKVEIEQSIGASNLVLTGEGCIDEQTERGKTISGIVARAQRHGRPVWALGGVVTRGAHRGCPDGVHFIQISHDKTSADESMARASTLLRAAVASRWAEKSAMVG